MPKKYRKKERIAVKFSLRTDGDKTSASTPVPINLYASYNGKRLKYSTGFTIAPKDWDAGNRKQGGAPKKALPLPRLRERLKNLEKWVNEIYHANDMGEISTADFRLELDYRTGKKKRPVEEGEEKLSFFPYFDDFIERAQKKKGAKRSGWKKYLTAKNHIQDYANELGITIGFDYWNITTLEEFVDWLYREPRELSTNTVSKIVDNLRSVLKKSYESTPQHHTNDIWSRDSFKVSRVDTKRKGRLTFNELDQLAAADFSGNPSLDKARDLMMVGCFTGLRFSDWHKVDKSYIELDEDGDEVLDIPTKKTREEVAIPVLPELKGVLAKYGYRLPSMTSQTFNRNIKKAVKAAGIDSTYTIIESIGGEIIVREKVPKCEMVSSHWGRRSFASNFYEEFSIPAKELMQITGHKTEKQFFGYIEYDRKKMARKAKIRIKQERQQRYLRKAE